MWLTRTLALMLTAAAPTAIGDVLLIESVQTSAQTASERPARGTSMARVEARFGAPHAKRPAIGEPPITRWDYPSFSVYFEHEHVIHAVARR